MKKVIILSAAMLISANVWASDSNVEGKQLFQSSCLSCHDAALDPPVAPPMFGVQKHYKRATADRDAFIDKVTAFAKNPSGDKALMRMAVEHLGVMPNPGVEEAELRKIAAYIHDESFALPCAHWKAGMKMAKARGDMEHFKKDQMRYNRMCADQPATAQAASKASGGSLRQVMQGLSREYANLNQAILREDFDGAVVAAHAIAYHDKPSVEDRMKLMRSMGTGMRHFKKADGVVHDLAIEVEKSAKQKDMPALIKAQSKLLPACMACHTTHRRNIIKILR